MHHTTSPAANGSVRQTCQRIIEDLIARHNWSLLSLEELVERVFLTIQPTSTPADIEQIAKNCYTASLYDACRQTDNLDVCERAYLELSRYLYRAAYNRWPEHAEDITQQALLVVHQRIDHCRNPERFRAFAVYMLLWAHRDFVGKLHDDVVLDQAENDVEDQQHSSIDAMLLGDERLKLLVDAIGRLLDERRRKVVFLKFFRKMSDSEIGEQLSMTAGNVRVLRNRALKQMRDDPILGTYFESSTASRTRSDREDRCNVLLGNGSS